MFPYESPLKRNQDREFRGAVPQRVLRSLAEPRVELVNQLPRAAQAAYNSGRAGGPTTCFEGTRVAVLKTIESWISDPSKSLPPVFWLNGMAGTGKSTIAKTIAEYAHDRGILGGSFFFSRDDQQLRDSSLVFPTLAFQLAQFADVFRSLIGKALQNVVLDSSSLKN